MGGGLFTLMAFLPPSSLPNSFFFLVCSLVGFVPGVRDAFNMQNKNKRTKLLLVVAVCCIE